VSRLDLLEDRMHLCIHWWGLVGWSNRRGLGDCLFIYFRCPYMYQLQWYFLVTSMYQLQWCVLDSCMYQLQWYFLVTCMYQLQWYFLVTSMYQLQWCVLDSCMYQLQWCANQPTATLSHPYNTYITPQMACF